MSYNGYTNWATWNVCLWIGNDEGLYYTARDLTRRANHHRPIEQWDAKAIVDDIFPNGTPDMQDGSTRSGERMEDVDWAEVADCLNELAGLTEEVDE